MSRQTVWHDATDDIRPDWTSSVPSYDDKAVIFDAGSDRITRSEDVWGGLATAAGTRVPVFMIADLEAEGEAISDIQKRYPHLTLADIYAALSYAHAFEGVIEQERLKYQQAVARYRR